MGELSGQTMLAVALLPLVVVTTTAIRPLATWALRVGPMSIVPALLVSLSGWTAPYSEIDWFLIGGQLGLDMTGRLFLFVSAFVWLVAAVFAEFTGVEGGRERRFFRYFYTAAAGNLLLVFAGGILTFFSGFALMSYAGYGLVVHKQDAEAIEASRIYVVMVVIGEILLLAGALIAWGASGSWELDEVRSALAEGGPEGIWAISLFFVGFGVKAALIPVHIWLPLAHPAAPVAASAVLSATMIKAGLLGWLRFIPFSSGDLLWLGNWAFYAGLAAAFLGVVLGLTQSKPKTILAYSSISQMGYMTMLVGLSAMVPGLYPAVLMALLVYVLHHAVAKGALFLSVIIARGAPIRPWWKLVEGIGLVVPALALAGAPLTTGAIAKSELKAIPYLSEGDLPVVFDPALLMGAVATTVLMARFLWVVWPRETRTRGVSVTGRTAWLVLATAAVWAPWLMPWEYFRDAAAGMVEPAALWSSFWPMATGVALSLMVIRRRRVLPFRIDDLVPAGDLVVPIRTALRIGRDTIGDGVDVFNKWWQKIFLEVKLWYVQRMTNVEVVEQLEGRLKKQAWEWVWILVVVTGLLAALIW